MPRSSRHVLVMSNSSSQSQLPVNVTSLRMLHTLGNLLVCFPLRQRPRTSTDVADCYFTRRTMFSVLRGPTVKSLGGLHLYL